MGDFVQVERGYCHIFVARVIFAKAGSLAYCSPCLFQLRVIFRIGEGLSWLGLAMVGASEGVAVA